MSTARVDADPTFHSLWIPMFLKKDGNRSAITKWQVIAGGLEATKVRAPQGALQTFFRGKVCRHEESS